MYAAHPHLLLSHREATGGKFILSLTVGWGFVSTQSRSQWPRSSKRQRSSCNEFIFSPVCDVTFKKVGITKWQRVVSWLKVCLCGKRLFNPALLAHSDWMSLKPWLVYKAASLTVAGRCKRPQTLTESNQTHQPCHLLKSCFYFETAHVTQTLPRTSIRFRVPAMAKLLLC